MTVSSQSDAALARDDEARQHGDSSKQSYREILKSSALIGGSSAINILVGIVRTKLMAILLGPAGFGLNGLYSSILDLTQSLSGMGVGSSGVRQIAEAASSNDLGRIAVTRSILAKTSIALGILGALFLILFSSQISLLTFGSRSHAKAVSVIAVAVFLKQVAAGQGALIQGLRRVADLAKVNIFGATFGTILGVPFVYFWREGGIVPALVAVASGTFAASWWFSRRVQLPRVRINTHETRVQTLALLKLGIAFMASSFLTMGAAYTVRILLVRQVGFAATGYYQSAWTLGGLYVGFILQAMGADFYPRLTAAAEDHPSCNRIVNEQTRIGILLAGPGVLATVTCAPLVMSIFYSVKFHAAIDILRWICLGTFIQVVSWPLGFIVLAKGRQNLFLLSDIAWTLVYIGLAWGCIRLFGLNGAGIAFLASYVFHIVLTYPIAVHLSGFCWSNENLKLGLILTGLITAVFACFYLIPPFWAFGLGILSTAGSALYSFRSIMKFVPLSRLPKPLRAVFTRLDRAGILCGLPSQSEF